MEPITKADRQELFKLRIVLIPTKLAREAQRLHIPIQDTCIEALRRKIYAQKKAS
jgi:hypothetical protein